MPLRTGITNYVDPLAISVGGMNTQIKVIGIHADNVAFADVPGYQRRVPVSTTFIETLAHRGVNEVVDTQVGRLFNTDQPLDLALATEGYFQLLQADGRIHMTRDGRFKLDKDGYLLSQDNQNVLSASGMPIQLPYIPDSLKRIRVEHDGTIRIEANPSANQPAVTVGKIGVASEDGNRLAKVDIRQAHTEHSNVFLHEEYIAFAVPRRSFQANRQIFLLQSQTLSKVIQELGRTQ
ncbi:MAG: hypothetical protein KC476_02480 [Cyanobacteria bacterium HKST-UBA06]|nr:hypothetical protein [Cyanobacteria bacterium HKST-UBA04]MCA9806796.1 hypothetical protein [Cyanobacteria bacterium HKST-UBA06]MCA9841421.1 hypothetical protein [Cyanobacteria bacterium HKST-UBA03]